ncbi:MAG TPA: HNH endonuclease signature motif containing protein [Anaerolineales bacterium]|nr:HNH endonuclease signature motif containing protein [Anaerolineales bacterium]
MANPFEDWPPTLRDDGGNWSKSQLTILRLLWPMEWVDRRIIIKEIGESYYDRKIRELRENGWHISAKAEGRNCYYRLESHKKDQGARRSYASTRVKIQLYAAQDRCQFCGATDNLQIDHKIPMERGGTTELQNLQRLCSPCNAEKRGQCKTCKFTTCDGCPYAHPELFSGRMVLFLEKDAFDKIDKLSKQKGVPGNRLVGQIISEFLGKK